MSVSLFGYGVTGIRPLWPKGNAWIGMVPHDPQGEAQFHRRRAVASAIALIILIVFEATFDGVRSMGGFGSIQTILRLIKQFLEACFNPVNVNALELLSLGFYAARAVSLNFSFCVIALSWFSADPCKSRRWWYRLSQQNLLFSGFNFFFEIYTILRIGLLCEQPLKLTRLSLNRYSVLIHRIERSILVEVGNLFLLGQVTSLCILVHLIFLLPTALGALQCSSIDWHFVWTSTVTLSALMLGIIVVPVVVFWCERGPTQRSPAVLEHAVGNVTVIGREGQPVDNQFSIQTMSSAGELPLLKLDEVPFKEFVCRCADLVPLISETTAAVAELALSARGGCAFAVSTDAAFESLKESGVDFRVVDKSDKWKRGYMTERLRGKHVLDASFKSAVIEFSRHTWNDRWPARHAAGGLPKDGFTALIGPEGYRLTAAVRLLGLRSPPIQWNNVGMRHTSALALSWELKSYPSIVIVRSDSGKVTCLSSYMKDAPVGLSTFCRAGQSCQLL